MREARVGARPERSLVIAVLLAGACARAFIALGRTDMVWPDEHFQTLEPAARVVLGRGIATWEWEQGFRSWIGPAVYMPILWVCRQLGLEGGIEVIAICRLVTALAGACVIPRLGQTLELLGATRAAAVAAMAAYALSVPMIVWAAATLTDTWALIALWVAMPALLRRTRADGGMRDWFVAGLLAGLPVLARIQMLACGAGFFFCLLVSRVALRRVAAAAAGYVSCLAVVGLVDWITWGVPWKSVLMQVTQGVAISRQFGTSPFHDYVRRVVDDQGVIFPALALALGAYGISGRRPRRVAAIVFVPLLALFAAHSVLAHKETRFILAVFPGLFVAAGLGLDRLLAALPRVGAAAVCAISSRRVALPMLAAAGAITTGLAARRPVDLSSSNVARLEEVIHRDGALDPAGRDCLLLIEHHWSLTRGQLVIGAPVRVIERGIHDLESRDLEACRYAILPARAEPGFRKGTEEGEWTKLAQTRGGRRWTLFRRDR